jgi:copper transport protein
VRRTLLVALVGLAAFPAGATAHATIEETAPERGAALAAPPREVRLHFSEPVEAAFGAVRVFDADGSRVEAGGAFHPGDRGDTVAVRLRGNLSDGSYTATYRVISADSHPIAGGFTFSVGEGRGPTQTVDELLAGSGSGPVTATALAVARAVQYAALAVSLGALLFLLLCWSPAAAGAVATAALRSRLRRLLAPAAAAGLASAVAGILLQGATAAGTSLWSALDATTVEEVLGTRFGTWWGIAALAWVAVLGLGIRGAALTPLLVLALVPALSGHAGTESPAALWIALNLLHVLAISAWVGGLAVLVLAVRSATAVVDPAGRTALLAATAGRFSTLAGAMVAVVLLTGIVQALAAIDDPSQLIQTAYGRAVLIKVVLFLGLVGLGAINRTRSLPGLRASTGTPGAAGVLLRRVLRAELAVAVVVLGVTGALAGYQPADTVSAGPFSGTAQLGPARMELTVDPARAGANELHLYLFDRRTGAQWDRPKEVRLQATLPDEGVEPISLEPRKAGPGHYVAAAATFAPAGDWRLTVIARVSDFDEFRTQVTIPIER